MSHAGSQQRTVLALLAALRPHWHRDRALPARIQHLLARNRAFGSRDRRLYRELIYTALRYLPWIEPLLDAAPDEAVRLLAWLAADSPATEKFRAALLADWPPCPPTVAEKIALLQPHPPADADSALLARAASAFPDSAFRHPHSAFPPPLPAWFRDHCPAAFEPAQLDALLARAPLWLRLQTPDPAAVTAEFARLGWRYDFSSVLPTALRLLDEVDVTKTDAFADGLIEIQDLGSQLLLASAAIAPGQRWLDACAGAGGKTLQLAQLLGPAGHVDASDIRPAALAELSVRATRAGLLNVTILPAAPTALYDGVLVDAPCSGTGTWRRSPHLKWTTTPAQIAAAAQLQLTLLTRFAAHVRPGGRLLYATCSLSREENESVVAAFLAAHPDFTPAPLALTFGEAGPAAAVTLLPAQHDTDGFFVAAFRRR